MKLMKEEIRTLKSRRKQGNETIIYLKQKAEQDIKVRQGEL